MTTHRLILAAIAVAVSACSCTTATTATPPPSTLAPPTPARDAVPVWVEGDSITAGIDGIAPWPTYVGWPAYRNTAVPGSGIDGVAWRLVAAAGVHGAPAEVWIMIGVNDSLVRSLAEEVAWHDRIADWAASNGIRLRWIAPPATTSRPDLAAWLAWWQAFLIAEGGSSCAADLGTPLPARYTTDGVHLNDLGNAALGACIRQEATPAA